MTRKIKSFEHEFFIKKVKIIDTNGVEKKQLSDESHNETSL